MTGLSDGFRRIFLAGVTLAATVVAGSGCAVVPAYERGHLADPTMQVSVDRAEERSSRKLHTSREAAAGGDARAAGGGCSCGN